jgi:serine/threonine protein kinase
MTIGLSGTLGLVKYPEQEQITRQGRPLGPYYFMAPEMRRHADTADGELADVYSLAKTLWSAATGRPDPPPGEIRSDRPALRVSSHLEDKRARSLDPLIERCTTDDPGSRLSMAELAAELAWWSDQSPVIPQLDLANYRDEVQRLHEANLITREETDDQRSNRLYNEAIKSVQSALGPLINAAMASAGLQDFAGGDNPIRDWSSEEYGGGATLPTWGIGSLASPWLSAAIGAVHRSQPIQDLDDMAVVFILARMTAESQDDYIREFKRFRPGSLSLDRAIAEIASMITEMLPGIIADFLTACKESGVPR